MGQTDNTAYQRFFAKIRENRPLGGAFFRLSFDWDIEQPPAPGRFLTFRVTNGPVPLLRRPFAFSGYSPAERRASVIVKRRGTATELLSRRTPGDEMDIIGPRGNRFPLPPDAKSAVLLAGGIGLGPLLFFARELRALGRRVSLIFGCRSREELPLHEELESCDPVLCTEDGSLGYRGTVLDRLDTLPDLDAADTVLYACGPTGMLKAAAGFAHRQGCRCWISMEQVMGCAVGACMGCAIRVAGGSGYARVCQEGPIFDSREIVWD